MYKRQALAQHMTPGNIILVNIYLEATKWPFSYIFIDLTQECNIFPIYLMEYMHIYLLERLLEKLGDMGISIILILVDQMNN